MECVGMLHANYSCKQVVSYVTYVPTCVLLWLLCTSIVDFCNLQSRGLNLFPRRKVNPTY